MPAGRVVVAYEADSIDAETRTGWTVVVTGTAQLVRDPAAAARYERVLQTWVDRPTDAVIRIEPELVTGYRLVTSSPQVTAARPP